MPQKHDKNAAGLVGEDTSYGDLSILTKFLGNSARIRILAALVSEDFHDLNVTQIAELAGVHRTTVYDHLDELEDLGVVIHTREVGGSPMYQFNHDSPLAKRLKGIEEDLLRRAESLEPEGSRE